MGNLEYNNQPVSESAFLRAKEMDHDSGCLGKIYGSTKNAPFNISGTVIFLLVASAIVITIWPPKDVKPLEFWQIILPVVTLGLGYLFGKKA
jgi:hypothetical protein